MCAYVTILLTKLYAEFLFFLFVSCKSINVREESIRATRGNKEKEIFLLIIIYFRRESQVDAEKQVLTIYYSILSLNASICIG